MATKKKIDWRNRIVETGEKSASEFNFNPANWREHNDTQRGAINGVLGEVGWVTGVIVNKTTGNLVDGHLRVAEALEKGKHTPVPFTLVDLTEDEERKMLLVLDPIGSLATMNADAFAELAASVGFDSIDLDDLVAQMSGENQQLEDLEPNLNDPNFNYSNQFGVLVECTDEKHQERIYNELQAAGHKVKVVTV